MRYLITYFIKYPIWERIIILVILGFGILSLMNMRSSFFPERDPRVINIQLTYPGASPEEIEEGAVLKIEDKLKGIAGLERVTSKSRENNATIRIEVLRNYDVEDILQEVKNVVNSIPSFPTDMEPPLIFKSKFMDLALTFSISGDIDLRGLKEYAKIIQDEIRGIDGISQVDISGYPDEEIVASIREKDLRNYKLTFDQIAQAIRNANFDLSSGTIKSKDEELLIKFRAKKYYAEGFKNIIVKTKKDGTIIRLEDIASVEDRWSEIPERTYINGEKAVVITIRKTLDEDIIEISDKIKEYIKDFNERNEIVKATILNDRRVVSLTQRIHLLTRNGLLGFILVLISLTFFINIRLAFWVALAIPVSFAGMFILANFNGISINIISLFAMIIVVGILVDDGIIIGENIYRHSEKGKSPSRAAIDGTLEVFPSVFSAIVTTIIAFLPFYFIAGTMGENMRDLAFVVIAAITISLFEGVLILPAHLAHSKALMKKSKISTFRKLADGVFYFLRDKMYAPSLRYFLKNKLLMLSIVVASIMLTIGAFKGGIIKTTFFPNVDRDNIDIDLVMKPGTTVGLTESVLDKIVTACWEVNDELKSRRKDKKDVILAVKKDVARNNTGAFGSHVGSVEAILLDGETRDLESYKIAGMIRQKVGSVYGSEQLTYGGGMHFGKPVSVSLVGPNIEDLQSIKVELKKEMSEIEALKDIMDNDMIGLRELNIRLKEKAYLLGLTRGEISRQIRQGFWGEEVQRIQRGMDEVKVWLRYDINDRSSLSNLENMRIKLDNGSEYPLSEVADYEIRRSEAVINHLDGKRVIRVEADLADRDEEVPPILSKINNEILPAILYKFKGVRSVDDGQKREINKTMTSSMRAVPIALIGMFIVIVLSFRSVPQAFVVFIMIPLGFIGASWGHLLFGKPISIMSYYGMIALAGIIVNDSIVFINAININLRNGEKFNDAVFNAGMTRFRPIILTTFTTFFGLAPLIFETSRQAQFLIPMAIAVSYGLLYTTIVILILLPVLVIILNKVRILLFWFWKGYKPTPEEVEPAYRVMQRHEKDDILQ